MLRRVGRGVRSGSSAAGIRSTMRWCVRSSIDACPVSWDPRSRGGRCGARCHGCGASGGGRRSRSLCPPAVWRVSSTRATDRPDFRNRGDHRLRHHRIVSVRGGDTGDQRHPVRVRDDVDLGAFLAAIDRTATDQRSPFFARTLAASRIAALQLRSPAAPSRSSISRCSASNTPVSAHTMNRRCAVGTLTPNDGGRCQAHPLVNTNTTAVNTARSSTGAVPPPCGLGANSGSSGFTMSHNASGASRWASLSTTGHIMPDNELHPRKTLLCSAGCR